MNLNKRDVEKIWEDFIYALGWKEKDKSGEEKWIVPVNFLGDIEKHRELFFRILDDYLKVRSR